MAPRAAPLALRAALCAVVAAARTNIGDAGRGYRGDDVCRCIDPSARGLNLSDCSQGRCFPTDYGVGSCLRHDDKYAPECQLEEPPKYCRYSWCYIDPKVCERPHHVSMRFTGMVMDNLEPLSYSYATCGNLNYYMRSGHELRNLKRKLRVSFPMGSSGTGFTMMRVSEGGIKDTSGRNTNITGSIVEFMAELFAFYGIEWELKEISPESQASSESVFTRCIHEVAINRTDVCWADFWMTEERLYLSNMITIFQDDMKVMVRRQAHGSSKSIGQLLQMPFAPFTWPLWATIFAQYAVCVLALFLVEGHVGDGDFTCRNGAREAVFKGLHHAFGGGLTLGPKTTPGKIIAAGICLSLMVFVSIYKAEVTSNLVASRLTAPVGEMASFEEGMERGARFCAHWFLLEGIRANWPGIRLVESGRLGVVQLFDDLQAGRCDAALISGTWWLQAQAGLLSGSNESEFFAEVYSRHPGGAETYHCDDKLFPLPVANLPFSISAGIPVTPELARPLEAAILQANLDPGRQYGRFREKHVGDFLTPVHGCRESAAGEEAQRGVAVLDGGGVSMVCLLFAAAGLLWWAVERSVHGRPQRKAVPDAQLLDSMHASLEAQAKALEEIQWRLRQNEAV